MSDSSVLELSPLFGDGAVLQRDRPVAVWGRAAAGAHVEVVVDGVGVGCVCGQDGTWRAVLPAHPAGTGYELTVDCAGERVRAVDVAYGDVWVLGGQSNMELPLSRVLAMFPDVLREAGDPAIRVFQVPKRYDFAGPHRELRGTEDADDCRWRVAGRDDIAAMSAVGYFFARRLREDVDVPVGLVSTAVGGSHIEAWMSRGALESLGALPRDFDRLTQPGYVENTEREYRLYEARYLRELDEADQGLARRWADPCYDDGDWDEMELSDPWQDELHASGAVWLRKVITIPDRMVGKSGQIRLGTMVDANECYLDGERIGGVDYRYPPSNYDVPSLPKTCTMAIRLKSYTGQGSLTVGKRHVVVTDDGDEFDLDTLGPWRVRRGCHMRDRTDAEFFSHMAVGDFNAMIAPLSGLSVTGVLWYQGESNTHEAAGYGDLLMALIQQWRELFGRADLPFLFAQLPNHTLEPEHDWPRLRDEQRRALALRNTAMIVTIGYGEDNDLHPLDKRHVGERFAESAEAVVYGFPHDSMGPLPMRAVCTSDTIEISFTHTGSGLQAEGALEFEVREPGGRIDRVTVPARRAVARDRVVIPFAEASGLRRGSVIRYAWADSPDLPLVNSYGLPATPFELLLRQ